VAPLKQSHNNFDINHTTIQKHTISTIAKIAKIITKTTGEPDSREQRTEGKEKRTEERAEHAESIDPMALTIELTVAGRGGGGVVRGERRRAIVGSQPKEKGRAGGMSLLSPLSSLLSRLHCSCLLSLVSSLSSPFSLVSSLSSPLCVLLSLVLSCIIPPFSSQGLQGRGRRGRLRRGGKRDTKERRQEIGKR
jgi:hypothetical protein